VSARSLPSPAKLAPYKTPEEAAPYTGFTANTLREKAKRREIPHRRSGKLIRFSDEDLIAIQESQAVKAETPALRVVARRSA